MDRKTIEDEKDYKKLQTIGREFEEDGHDITLNAKTEELRAELLKAFDEHYADGKDEEDAEGEDKSKVELGADETESEEKQPNAAEAEAKAEAEARAKAEAEVEAKAEAEAKAIAEQVTELEPEEKPKVKLYVARRMYRLWLGVDEYAVFMPNIPKELPEGLNKDAKARLKAAIKNKRIVVYEE